MEKKIDNSILNVNPGEEKIGWVEWEYLKNHATHIRCNRCHYGKQEAEEGVAQGYKPAEIKEAETNIHRKEIDFYINGWRENCTMLIGYYNGQCFVIDGNNRWTALCRVNKDKLLVPHIHVIVRYYESEDDMQRAFDETNGNMVPQKKTQKMGRNARLHGGDELEGFNTIQDFMADTGTSISTACVLYTGYRTSKDDNPALSKNKFVFTSEEVVAAFKLLINAFKNDDRTYILSKLKGVEFAMGFQSVCGRLVRYAMTMMSNVYKNNDEKLITDLGNAYADMANAVVKKCRGYRSDVKFTNDFRGRSADFSMLISEICKSYNKSNNPIFNAVFEHYDKVA